MPITLTSEYMQRQMAQAVPGAVWSDGAWVLEQFTPRAAAVALKLFPHLALAHPELVASRDSMIQDIRPFDNATPFGRRIEPTRVQAEMDKAGYTLHDYQALDLGYGEAILRRDGGYYMAWERGLGKTLGTCCLIDAMDAQATMVVCPNTAKLSVWAEDLARWCPWVEVLVMPNAKAKREALLTELTRPADKPIVLVAHYESLGIVAGKGKTKAGNTKLEDGWKKLGIVWDLVVCDEGHRLSNEKAQMTKAAKKVPSSGRVILSGSIIQNHPEELFSQLQFLYPERYKAKNRDWCDRYLDYVDNGYGRTLIGILPGRQDELQRELGIFMTYRRKKDELVLPPRTDDTRYVDLSAGQRKAYDEVFDTCMTELEDGTRVKANVGAAMMGKLRQVATGLDLLGEVVDSAKLDLAVEMILDGEDDDFVVFSWYKACGRALQARLEAKGVETFLVDGDVSHARREDFISRFKNGERRVFIGTLSTLGESVNLQRANNVIMLDRSFNPSLNDQAEDRVHRQGQKRTTTITSIVARNTVDEYRVMPALLNKEALRAAVLGAK